MKKEILLYAERWEKGEKRFTQNLKNWLKGKENGNE